MDGLQNWFKLEVQHKGAQVLAMIISIVESLVEFKRSNKGKAKPHKSKEGGVASEGKAGDFKNRKRKEGGFKFKKPESKNGDRPPIKCFLCEGPHRARKCPKRNKLSALMEQKEGSSKKGEEASMGSLQLAVALCKQEPRHVKKGKLFVNVKVGDQELRALIDNRASNNFIRLEEANKFGIKYERTLAWLKAKNSKPNMIHGTAHKVPVKIGE